MDSTHSDEDIQYRERLVMFLPTDGHPVLGVRVFSLEDDNRINVGGYRVTRHGADTTTHHATDVEAFQVALDRQGWGVVVSEPVEVQS